MIKSSERTKTVFRVVKRLAVEFVPPIFLAAIWTWWKFPESKGALDSAASFSAAYLLTSYPYLQILRITHQDYQRQLFQELKTMLTDISKTVTTQAVEFQEQAKGRPELLEPVANNFVATANTANMQIAAANTVIDKISISNLGTSDWIVPPSFRTVHPAHMSSFSDTPLPLRVGNATVDDPKPTKNDAAGSGGN